MYALEIEQLTKTYSGGVEALKGIDFKVKSGDFFALLGPNGAGKSTLIGIVSSLVNKSSGSVKIFGIDPENDRFSAMAQLGLVPQEINFNQFERPLDILINQAGYYGVPRDLAIERAKIYLTKLGLWEKHDQPSRGLSGGMKRRLMIARAMIHHPRLLILDEPTAGVDIEVRRSMWEFVNEINAAGTTVILTTHYLEEAEQLCKNIAIIDQGNIVENTSVKSLLSRLDVETFIFDVDESMAQLPVVEDLSIRQVDEMSLEIDIPKTTTINSVFAALDKQNIHVLSMRNKINRLEELFLRMIQKS